MMYTRSYLAELLGTFLFFTVGLASIQVVLVMGNDLAPLMVVVPFGFGFGLLAAIFAFGHISGGHFNPAVSIAMVVDGRMPAVKAAGYVVSQVIGAIGAAGLILVLFSQASVASTVTHPGNGFDDLKALILETVLTAIFLLVILSSRSPVRHSTRHGASARRSWAATWPASGSTSSRRSSAPSSARSSTGQPTGAGTPTSSRPDLEVLQAEPASVAHLAPDAGLGDLQQLADVIPVVVDPLAEELVDP
jgi:glycerol uptake facilitator-like aquaporin